MNESFVNLDRVQAIKDYKDAAVMRECVGVLTAQVADLIGVIKDHEEKIERMNRQLWSLEITLSNAHTELAEQQRAINQLVSKQRLFSAVDVVVVFVAAALVGGTLALCLLK